MSAAKPLAREKRLENYGVPFTVAQARQVRKTDVRRDAAATKAAEAKRAARNLARRLRRKAAKS